MSVGTRFAARKENENGLHRFLARPIFEGDSAPTESMVRRVHYSVSDDLATLKGLQAKNERAKSTGGGENPTFGAWKNFHLCRCSLVRERNTFRNPRGAKSIFLCDS